MQSFGASAEETSSNPNIGPGPSERNALNAWSSFPSNEAAHEKRKLQALAVPSCHGSMIIINNLNLDT